VVEAVAMRLMVSFVIISRLWLCAMPAAAQVTAVAGGTPNHVDLSIPVAASVAIRCGIAIGGICTAPDIHAAFTHDVDFTLVCNVASRVGVDLGDGGLLMPVGYAGVAPYLVTLNLAGNTGAPSAHAIAMRSC
jgi:hypothetical protein